VLSDWTSIKLLFIFVNDLWDQKFSLLFDFNFHSAFLNLVCEKHKIGKHESTRNQKIKINFLEFKKKQKYFKNPKNKQNKK
jgi:hypothetical protein